MTLVLPRREKVTNISGCGRSVVHSFEEKRALNFSRRKLALLLPAVAAAQEKPQPAKLPSKSFRYEDLPVKESGQNKQRAVLNGATHSGFMVEMHLTELGPGQAPHAPHKHVHEEMVLLQTGQLDVTIEG